MFLQLLLTCIIFTFDVRAQNCHQDWLYHDGSCYGFGETALSWAEAQAMCRSFDSKLIEIETSSENDYIKGMATTKHNTYYWIGATDVFHEGVWEWASTRQNIVSFTDWIPGDPNDIGGDEDCLVMVASNGYQWADAKCINPAFFICEASPIEVAVVG